MNFFKIDVTFCRSHSFYIQEGQNVILSRDNKVTLAEVYDRYADMLYRLALSHTQSREDAEDAVQDVFTKYIATSPRFTDTEHERAWLVRVTVNRCHDRVRRGKLRTHESMDDITDLPSEESPEGGVIRTLSELPEKYRTAIALHYLEGFSVEEISKMLGISLSATKMRLSRGRELLKNILTDEEKNDV
jgi:RNA polymerase sigma-70 factor (ECF subfamily)